MENSGDVFYSFIYSDNGDAEKRAKFIVKFLENTDATVLDPFAGTGNLGLEISKYGFRVIMLESSLGKFSVILEKIKSSKNFKNLIAAFPLDFTTTLNNFQTDAVIISNSISHLSDSELENAVINSNKNLKVGGILILNSPKPDLRRKPQEFSLIQKKVYGNSLIEHYGESSLSDTQNIYNVNFEYIMKFKNITICNIEQNFNLYIRDLDKVINILKSKSFEVLHCYSDWDEKLFKKTDSQYVVVAKKIKSHYDA